MALGTFNANGLFYTNYNPAELNQRSFSNMILRLFPNGSAPLFALTGEAGRKRAKASTHGYFTKHFAITKPKVDGAKVAGDTSITFDSTAGIVPGMVFQVPATRENIRCTSVTSSTVAVFQRSFGGVAAGAIADNAELILVGNAHTEASTRPTERSMAAVYVPNYTSILRNAWALSDTARASLAEAGYNNVAENKLDCMTFHSTDFESQMIWGQPVAPVADAATGKLIHSTQGFIDAMNQYASSNIQTAAATTNYSELVDLVDPALSQSTSKDAMGRKERTIFCDNLAMKVFHDIGMNSADVNMTIDSTTFGMQFTEFRTYRGSFRLLEHPLLSEMSQGAGTGLALIIDLPTVGVAYMDGRDIKKEQYDGSGDSTGDGIDAVGGSLTSEFATEFHSPPTCGIVNGITAYA